MIRVGVVGAGFIGRIHAQSAHDIRIAELSGVYDKRKDVAERVVEEFGGEVFDSYEQLLEKSDVVVLAVPTPFRGEYLEKALRMGRHVFCEKPLARTLEEAERIREIVRTSHSKFMVDHVVRFFPEYRKIRDSVASGKLGEISEVRSFRGGPFPGWADWFRSFEKSGGVLLDLAIHDLDFWMWTLGEVRRIWAFAKDFSESIERDHGVIVLEFENGAIAHIEATWAYPAYAPFRTSAEVVGTRGRVIFDSELFKPFALFKEEAFIGDSPLSLTPWGKALEAFLVAVERDEEVPVTVEDGLRAVRMSLLAIESARSGEAKVVKA